MNKNIRNYFFKQYKRLDERKLLFWVPDKVIIKLHYYLKMGKWVNFKKPITLNEKLQWLKLYDRKPQYSIMADKYRVREFIAESIGEEYLIPIIGSYENFDDIDFDCLPNQFVLKTNHDSGGIIICRDKNKFDIDSAKISINKWLRRNYYQSSREWQYKNIPPRIIIEKYMDDGNEKGLTDFKFFCFNGNPEFVYISMGLEDHSTAFMSFYDLEKNKLPFKRSDYNEIPYTPDFPKHYDKMIELSRELAIKTCSPFIRVDFYEIEGKVYFSELTFRPNAGMIPFEPIEYDRKLGNMLKL